MSLVAEGHGPGCGGEADSPFFLLVPKTSTCRTASLEAPLLLLLCAEPVAPSLHVAQL